MSVRFRLRRLHGLPGLAVLLAVLILLMTAPACAGSTACAGNSACAGHDAPPPAAVEVLAGMQSAVLSLPSGVVYARTYPADHPSYLTGTLLSALYGEAARGIAEAGTDSGTGDSTAEQTVPPVNDAALFLPLAMHPCELAVFRCSDARATATAAGLCRARLDEIRNAWEGTEWAALTERGCVAVEGSFVLLVVADDPQAVLDAARRVIG